MEIKGLNLNNIRKISEIKNEDNWVKEYREKSFEYFTKMPLPHFGPSADVDFEKIIYYKTSEEDRKY